MSMKHTMTDARDAKIQRLCIAHIEKCAMDINDWTHTVLGRCHDERIALGENELPVVSIYFSADSWTLLTTRRVLGSYLGCGVNIPTLEIAGSNFGNFKGQGNKGSDVFALQTLSRQEMRLEYETGKPSMAPIYYFRFWAKKAPLLEMLVG
jgi:hypothetical protein